MLTHSTYPLPVEIYCLIYVYLDCADLSRLLRVCRVLFKSTVPFVWRNGDLVSLLGLLPGYRRIGKDRKVEATPPKALSDDYFSRFHLYAPYVEHLDLHPNTFINGDAMSQADQDWIQSYVSEHNMLPHLTTAALSFVTADTPTHRGWVRSQLLELFEQPHVEPAVLASVTTKPPDQLAVRFWVQVLISGPLSKLNFWADREDDMHILGSLLSKSPRLTRLEFHIPPLAKWDAWSWVAKYPIPRTLENLHFESFALSHSALTWMSKLSKLHTLKLSYPDRNYPEELEDLSHLEADECSPGSFTELKSLSLHLSATEWPQASQVLRTPIVANITHLTVVSSHQVGFSPPLTREFFVALAAHCPGVCHFEMDLASQDFDRQFRDRGLPLSVLSDLRVLPLHTLRIWRLMDLDAEAGVLQTIGNLWPHMEKLSLDRTVIQLSDLLQLPTYLPMLRYLKLHIPIMKLIHGPLSSTIGTHLLSRIVDPTIHIAKPKLTVEFFRVRTRRNLFDYDLEDQDLLARILVALSSDICIIDSPNLSTPGYFRERVTYYLEARSGKLELGV